MLTAPKRVSTHLQVCLSHQQCRSEDPDSGAMLTTRIGSIHRTRYPWDVSERGVETSNHISLSRLLSRRLTIMTDSPISYDVILMEYWGPMTEQAWSENGTAENSPTNNPFLQLDQLHDVFKLLLKTDPHWPSYI